MTYRPIVTVAAAWLDTPRQQSSSSVAHRRCAFDKSVDRRPEVMLQVLPRLGAARRAHRVRRSMAAAMAVIPASLG